MFFIVVTGGPKLGDVEAGLVAAAFGAPVSVITGGVACLVGALVTARVYPELPGLPGRHRSPGRGLDGQRDAAQQVPRRARR